MVEKKPHHCPFMSIDCMQNECMLFVQGECAFYRIALELQRLRNQ